MPATGASPLSIGVVGMNYWGPNLARNFDRLDGCRVTWICDRDESVLDRHRPAYRNSRFTSRYEDLLEDLTKQEITVLAGLLTRIVERGYKRLRELQNGAAVDAEIDGKAARPRPAKAAKPAADPS